MKQAMDREALAAWFDGFKGGAALLLDGRLTVVPERMGDVLALCDLEGRPLWDPPVEDGYPELRPEYAGLSMFLSRCEFSPSFDIVKDGDSVLIGPHRLEPGQATDTLRRRTPKGSAKPEETKSAMKKNTKKMLERCLKGIAENHASSYTSAIKTLMGDIEDASDENEISSAKERFLSELDDIHARYSSVAAEALSSIKPSDLVASRFDETVRAFLDDITGCTTVDVSMLGDYAEAILCNNAKCHVDYLVRSVSDKGDCRSEGVLVGIFRDRKGTFFLQGKLPSGSTEFMELAGASEIKCRYINSVHGLFRLPAPLNDDGTPSDGGSYLELKKSTYRSWLDDGVVRASGISLPAGDNAQREAEGGAAVEEIPASV